MKTIVNRSPKGGVGKTVLSLNIASAFNANGVKTALIDADDQGTTEDFSGALRAAMIEEMEKEIVEKITNPQNFYNDYHAARNIPILEEKLRLLKVYKQLIVSSIDLKEQLKGIAAKERLESTIDSYKKQGVEVIIFDLKGEHNVYSSYLASKADLTLLVSDNGLYSLRSVYKNIIVPSQGNLPNHRTLIVNRFKNNVTDSLEINNCVAKIAESVNPLGEMSHMSVYRQCSEKGFGVIESFDKKESIVKAQKEIEGLAIKINDIIKVR